MARGEPLVLAVRGRAIVLEQPKDRAKAFGQLTAHARHSTDWGIATWSLGHGDAADLDEITDMFSQSLVTHPTSSCSSIRPSAPTSEPTPWW